MIIPVAFAVSFSLTCLAGMQCVNFSTDTTQIDRYHRRDMSKRPNGGFKKEEFGINGVLLKFVPLLCFAEAPLPEHNSIA